MQNMQARSMFPGEAPECISISWNQQFHGGLMGALGSPGGVSTTWLKGLRGLKLIATTALKVQIPPGNCDCSPNMPQPSAGIASAQTTEAEAPLWSEAVKLPTSWWQF